MKKNVAGQTIGAQMINATTGAAFSGLVTVYITKDAGTQTVGSVGSPLGECVHEGNGYHSYLPSQAETNADHIAFTFTGSGAIPVTIQVYTSFPQSADAATLATDIQTVTDKLDTLLEPATGSPGDYRFSSDALRNTPACDLGTLPANVSAIKAKTDNLPADPADASDIASSFSTVNATLATIDSRIDTEVPAIKAVTDKLDTMLQAAGGSPGDYEFNADSLRNAPTGSGGGGGASVADIVAGVWGESLPGAFAAGTAGKIVGDNINATISSRATQTSVDAVDDYVDTEVAAIKVVTDKIDTLLEAASGSPGDYRFHSDAFSTTIPIIADAVWNDLKYDHQADDTMGAVLSVQIPAALVTLEGYLDTEIAAIKAKTDLLPAATAGTSGGLVINGSNAGAISFTNGMTISNATGTALTLTSSGGNGNGISASGNGSGDGMACTGGATGRGIHALGGATSGAGLLAAAQGDNSNGITITGFGSGHGLAATGGPTGSGIHALGGATSGAGFIAEASGGNSNGLECIANGSGTDLAADNIASISSIVSKLDTMLEASGSPADYRFTDEAVGKVADVVWNEQIAGHSSGGSAGATLQAAGSAGDPWSTAIPGAYAAGTAGYIVGTNLDAAVSAVKSKTDNLPSDPADASVIAASFATVNSTLSTVDTEVSAIKSVTDKVDTMLEASGSPADYRFTDEAVAKVADVVLNEQVTNHLSGGSVGAALRDTDLRGDRTVLRGTVGSASTPSTTQFTPSSLGVACAAADQLKGRIIVFDRDTSTQALRGQATDITASSNASLPLLTFTALTTAPSSGDTFTIV